MDLVEPNDLVAARGNHAGAEDRRLRLLARLHVVGEEPARDVDVDGGGVVELDPVHLRDALLGHEAALGRIGVGGHDLVDPDRAGDRDGRREGVRRELRGPVDGHGCRRGAGERIALGGGEGHGYLSSVKDRVDAFNRLDRDAVRRDGRNAHVCGQFWESQSDLRNEFRSRHFGGGERLVRIHDDVDRRIADKAVADGWRERNCCGSVAIDRVGVLDGGNFDIVCRHGDERHVRLERAKSEFHDRRGHNLFGNGICGECRKAIAPAGELGAADSCIGRDDFKPVDVVTRQHGAADFVLDVLDVVLRLSQDAKSRRTCLRNHAGERDPLVRRRIGFGILGAAVEGERIAVVRDGEASLDAPLQFRKRGVAR